MKQIRIGKDISLRWEITTDGEAMPLEGRDLTVELKSPIGKVINMPFRVDGNVLIMTYYGYEQKYYGEYSITLWENRGKPGQNVVDAISAFKLVRTSQEEDDFIGGDLQVECVDLGTANLDILLGSTTSGDSPDLSALQRKVDANTTRISAVEDNNTEQDARIASLLQDTPWEGKHINMFTETGEYHIHGERTDENDGLPIINAASGHTIDARLTVLDSSLTRGTGEKTDTVVTQILRLSNRTGGDGHVYVRTAQAANKIQLATPSSTAWGTWEKLMGMFEKNSVKNITDLDTYTTNGMYSGLFADTTLQTLGGLQFTPGDTFLLITVNGYAASAFGTPQLTQMLYLLSAKTGSEQFPAKMYIRTAWWDVRAKVWAWANWDRLAMASEISGGGGGSIYKLLVSITWSELKALRDNSQLVAGTWYRITDYTCTTIQENTRSAGHIFDVIVRADSENKLNEEAFAIQHEGDDYFASSNLSAWKLWYSIDNDTTRFAWADAENGKGVIYRMIDEWNNDVPYDFKNINFKRYIIEANNAFATNAAKGGEIDVVKAMLKDTSHKINTDLWYYGAYVSDVYPDANPDARYVPFGDVTYENAGPQVICLIDENNYGWFYTFHNEDKDASLLKHNVNEKIGVCDNTIKDSCYVFLVEEGTGSYYPTEINAQSLNNIVFLGNSCYSNSFGNRCASNSFGNDCYSNSFGNSFYSNSLGNGCASNSFGNDCNSNSFGNRCASNSFGNRCASNSFGNDCYYNSFGNRCYSNSFGNDCTSNSFGNSCYSNSLGNGCNYNSFGNYCNYNMFASDSSASTKYNYYCNNHFGDSCQYIVLKGVGDASSSKLLQNYNFAQGVQGTPSNYLNIDGVRNLSYETKVAKNSSGELKIYCEADLVQ